MRLGDRAAMSTASSVLIAADPPTLSTDTPRYTLLLSTDPALIEASQRLRHDVFTSERGVEDPHLEQALDGDGFRSTTTHRNAKEAQCRAGNQSRSVVAPSSACRTWAAYFARTPVR